MHKIFFFGVGIVVGFLFIFLFLTTCDNNDNKKEWVSNIFIDLIVPVLMYRSQKYLLCSVYVMPNDYDNS